VTETVQADTAFKTNAEGKYGEYVLKNEEKC
jgi:hypothetical protein